MTRSITSAGLLHVIGWDLPFDTLELSPFIKVCRMENSIVAQMYETLCAEKGIDEGEPYWYDSFVLLEPDGDTDNINSGDPYCLLDRVCNVIALVLARPIAMCRVVQSEDKFKTCLRTYEIFQYGLQTDFLMKSQAYIDAEKGAEIKAAWTAASSLWNEKKSASRVNSALTYFYYAWRSPYLDQCCLNLAVCLELLFTPHSQGEVSHQISFNVAHFLGRTPAEMKDVYRVIRNFYGIRSRIVHGGMPGEEKVITATVETFRLTSESLCKILTRGFGQVFDTDNRRKELLASFLFG